MPLMCLSDEKGLAMFCIRLLCLVLLLFSCKVNLKPPSLNDKHPSESKQALDGAVSDKSVVVERSVGAEDISLPNDFVKVSKDKFLAQVSVGEDKFYSLSANNFYAYYQVLTGAAETTCTQYLAVSKRVWRRLEKQGLEIRMSSFGYSFTTRNTDESQRVLTLPMFCYADLAGKLHQHRVLIVYESHAGVEKHRGQVVSDAKKPLVYPRLEVLRGDKLQEAEGEGKVRSRDTIYLDAGGAYIDQDVEVAAEVVDLTAL